MQSILHISLGLKRQRGSGKGAVHRIQRHCHTALCAQIHSQPLTPLLHKLIRLHPVSGQIFLTHVQIGGFCLPGKRLLQQGSLVLPDAAQHQHTQAGHDKNEQ